ncbi:exodeoxyribonuclease V subunit alpha [Succinivibrio dextrinosolvens]|uniref:exodeoxyribonuclease V subunit alpha n=1 Tax=Succinivibrio dextrinosolvens TaxID=83771 RepID=UPI0019231978|nr:exodeoxyribonuclease V subunit alpha [Succinivibrio dextrinosolvens]
MRKFEKISDLLEEYTELCNPLLDAVLKTLGIMHESSLPFALELMIAELLYKQSSGDTCIRADAKSVNSFFKDIFTNRQEIISESESEYMEDKREEFSDLISESEISAAFTECSDLIGQDESSNKPLIFDLGRLYIRRNFCYEKIIADFIRDASSDNSKLSSIESDKDNIRAILDKLFDRASDNVVTGSMLDMQKIAAAMAAVSRFCIITGGPGTGKTTTVAKLLLLLQKIKPEKSNILLCAPTGKAAGRMTESIKKQFAEPKELKEGTFYSLFTKLFPDAQMREEIKSRICKTASTVDKLLGSIPHKAHKIRNAENRLDCDILIVDEVSMVDAANFAKLCSCIRDDTQVIMLGDKEQLASVEAGSVLNDLCHDLDCPSRVFNEDKLSLIAEITGYSLDELKASDISFNAVQLNYSYRFARFAGIGTIATAVNKANEDMSSSDLKESLMSPFDNYKEHLEFHPLVDFRKWKEKNDYISSLCSLGTDKENIVNGFNSYWDFLDDLHMVNGRYSGIDAEQAKEVFSRLDEYRILCSNRDGIYGVKSINDQIEKTARERLKSINIKASSTDSEWFIGKVILVTKNNYALKISNGDVGFVAAERMADGSAGPLKVWFGNEESVFNVSPVFLVDYENGYAMTIHKSQGSEYKNVCMMLSTKLNPVMTKELVYTGITRAKEHVSIYSDEMVYLDACKRRVSRESGLTERL